MGLHAAGTMLTMRVALVLVLGVAVTGCVSQGLTCVGASPSTIESGRQMRLEWSADPVPNVKMNAFNHRIGDGWTAHVDVADERFLVVVLQDTMWPPEPGARPQRWTMAQHFELKRGADGYRLRHWEWPVGPPASEAAREARTEGYEPMPEKPGETHIWRCS